MGKLDLLSMISARRRGRALAVAAGLTLTIGVVLSLLDQRLSETGDGTIGFEIAGSVERAEGIVAGWEEHGVLAQAALLDGLDYLFALTYAITLALGCMLAALHWRRVGRFQIADRGELFALAALAAAGFDWVEDAALGVSLLDRVQAPFPQLALGAAIIKFGCVGLSSVYAASGGVAYLWSRRPRPSRA